MDQQFNLAFKFKSVFNLEFQPEFGIQVGIPILMGINLGECMKVQIQQATIHFLNIFLFCILELLL